MHASPHSRHRRHGRRSMPSTSPPSRASTLVGGVDVDPERRRGLQRRRTTSRTRFASLDAAIAWGEFDAVRQRHAGLRPSSDDDGSCIAAGKHVFCEKPLATDYAKAVEMTEAAETRRPRQHGQPHLPQRRRSCRRRARSCCPARSATVKHVEASLPAELAGLEGLGRLAHREPVAVAAVEASTAPTACSAISASTSSTSPPTAPASTSTTSSARLQDLRQGARQPDRRVRSRRQ